MTPLILITRPREDAAETAAQIEAAGFDVLSAPMLEIHDTGIPLPNPSACQGLIFSSAHGVRSFMRRGPEAEFLSMPVFAVGDHTAREARQAGFADIRNASGTMKDLVGLVRDSMTPPLRLLHVRGRDVRDDPAALLDRNAGWMIDGITLYAADPVETMPSDAMEVLAAGLVDAVLFYSARSAQAFASAVLKAGQPVDFAWTRAFCLSDSVVESIRRFNWADIRVASYPDNAGMMALIKTLETMQTDPNSFNDADAMQDAERVIERFGGIRPMASKLNIPVTTVQGWKKRNVIPGNRRADVMDAARTHNVDISDIVANQNDFSATLNVAAERQMTDPQINRIHEQALEAAKATEQMESSGVTREAMMSEIKKSQSAAVDKAVRRSVAASVALLCVFAVIYGLLIAVNKQHMARVETRIADIQSHPGEPGGLNRLMQDMTAKYDDLRGKVDTLQTSMQDLKTQTEGFFGPPDATLSARISTLERKLSQIAGGDQNLSMVMSRVDDMSKSIPGQQKMDEAVADLKSLVAGLQGRMDKMDEALADQQKGDSALAQTLEGVSPRELKAAAMLIGLNQFRDTMNRSGPFGEDLALLETMLGDKDPELNEAIARLAPYAEQGVLSPSGLSDELKSLTGDIVVASLNGEDVSFRDRAMARFENVLKITKDGQPVTGAPA
ncbi:MAG TPA: uroporphyrinogen-III synthase, partial [Micavibrio sp.]